MPTDSNQAPRPRLRPRGRVRAGVAGVPARDVVAALAAWLPSALAAQQGPPQVATGGVSHIRGTSAELEGTVYPHGLATTYFFQYGPTTAYGSTTPQVVLPAATSRIKVGQITSGLQPGYHYRIVAFNAASNGLARVGKDRVFDSKSRKLKFYAAQVARTDRLQAGLHAEREGDRKRQRRGRGRAAGDPLPVPGGIPDRQLARDDELERRLQLPGALADDERRVPRHHDRRPAPVQRHDQAGGHPDRGAEGAPQLGAPGSCACTAPSAPRSPARTC